MSDQDDSLPVVLVAIVRNDDPQELSKRFDGIRLPRLWCKFGEPAAWQIDTQTRRNVHQTGKERMELGKGAT